MSPKDLCTIEFIDELIKAGIDSFKIEGRMRSRLLDREGLWLKGLVPRGWLVVSLGLLTRIGLIHFM